MYGSLLLDQVAPLRRVVLITIPNGVHLNVSEIEDREEFWNWQRTELPAFLDKVRAQMEFGK